MRWLKIILRSIDRGVLDILMLGRWKLLVRLLLLFRKLNICLVWWWDLLNRDLLIRSKVHIVNKILLVRMSYILNISTLRIYHLLRLQLLIHYILLQLLVRSLIKMVRNSLSLILESHRLLLVFIIPWFIHLIKILLLFTHRLIRILSILITIISTFLMVFTITSWSASLSTLIFSIFSIVSSFLEFFFLLLKIIFFTVSLAIIFSLFWLFRFLNLDFYSSNLKKNNPTEYFFLNQYKKLKIFTKNIFYFFFSKYILIKISQIEKNFKIYFK